MDFSFLTDKITDALECLDENKLYEIRIRNGFAVSVNYDKRKMFLSSNGVTRNENSAIIADRILIENIIDNLTEKSVYAYNENIKRGFLTSKDGARVGLSGECVFDDKIVTVKNIQSLNVRIPHLIEGCSDVIFDKIKDGFSFYNTLIISPPFCGKTTILKDIALKINRFYNKNILIIDERGEFSEILGARIDSIKFSDKLYAFEYGIRSLSPEIVITDELSDKDDWLCAKRAASSGITIISTCHAKSIENVKNKDYFVPDVFERFIVLKKGCFGVLEEVYDRNFMKI